MLAVSAFLLCFDVVQGFAGEEKETTKTDADQRCGANIMDGFGYAQALVIFDRRVCYLLC